MQCINRMIVSVVSVFDCLLNCSTGTVRVHYLFKPGSWIQDPNWLCLMFAVAAVDNHTAVDAADAGLLWDLLLIHCFLMDLKLRL